jgi:hypothetical protein
MLGGDPTGARGGDSREYRCGRNTLFLRAIRVKDRLDMSPIFATFRDAAQCAWAAVFAILLI